MANPLCPDCGEDMVLRTGRLGKFYGCSRYPACRRTRPYNGDENSPAGRFRTALATEQVSQPAPPKKAFGKQSLASIAPELLEGASMEKFDSSVQSIYAPVTNYLIPGSEEQERFWDFCINGSSHGVLEAVAGSGKTFSIVQAILRLKRSLKIGVFAFNNHIAKEMNARLQEVGVSHARALTYNSFGFRACRNANPRVELLEGKLDTIVSATIPEYSPGDLFSAVSKLVRLCKCYMLDGTSDDLETLAEKHDVEVGGNFSEVCQYVPRILKDCLEQSGTIDFDDQVWFTVKKKYAVEQFDILFVDEFQDTNRLQQEMALMACPTGRIIIVGDRHQAIYGFRGADVDAIPSMLARLSETARKCSVFPLTFTRRCPKKHVQLAQAVVPEIKPMPDAPEGLLEAMPQYRAVEEMEPGDLVLSRVNRPLIQVCYSLIRKGVKALIRGRDIGKGLLSLIGKLRPKDPSDLMLKLREYEKKEMEKLAALGKKGHNRIISLQDRVDCIIELADGVNDIPELRAKIEKVFAEFDDSGKPKDAVVLGTVHRTKGLESRTVWVLCPELIPHPMATQPWERNQESNLAYVAATRCKYSKEFPGRLVFVGQVPPLYGIPPLPGGVEAKPFRTVQPSPVQQSLTLDQYLDMEPRGDGAVQSVNDGIAMELAIEEGDEPGYTDIPHVGEPFVPAMTAPLHEEVEAPKPIRKKAVKKTAKSAVKKTAKRRK